MHLIHDLRLLLLAITACLEPLQFPADGAHAPQQADLIASLVESGLALVDELLVADPMAAPAPLEVNAVLEDIDPIVRMIAGSEITVRTTLAKSSARIHAARGDLERILLNLVFNAAAAMPAGGVLAIEASKTDLNFTEAPVNPAAPYGDLHLTVSDSGRGMSDCELARAINPLALPRPDGTGLGLASVALIVTRLGGSIRIDSTEETGTVVRISLPLVPPNGNLVH